MNSCLICTLVHISEGCSAAASAHVFHTSARLCQDALNSAIDRLCHDALNDSTINLARTGRLPCTPPAAYKIEALLLQQRVLDAKTRVFDCQVAHVTNEMMRSMHSEREREAAFARVTCEGDVTPPEASHAHMPPATAAHKKRGAKLKKEREKRGNELINGVRDRCLRPHTLVAEGRIHLKLKAAYTRSVRLHTLLAYGLILYHINGLRETD